MPSPYYLARLRLSDRDHFAAGVPYHDVELKLGPARRVVQDALLDAGRLSVERFSRREIEGPGAADVLERRPEHLGGEGIARVRPQLGDALRPVQLKPGPVGVDDRVMEPDERVVDLVHGAVRPEGVRVMRQEPAVR